MSGNNCQRESVLPPIVPKAPRLKMAEKIGLFGGSFDPVHLAHVALAKQALKQLNLDQVIWIPAFISPFKSQQDMLANPQHRLAMIRLICAQQPQFKVSSYEIDKAGVSYSIETLRYFQGVFSAAQFFWILGSDALAGLPQWKEAKILIRDLTFLVAGRGQKMTGISKELKTQVLDLDWNPVSSREIKSGLVRGEFWDQLDPGVAAYIRQNRLYGVNP